MEENQELTPESSSPEVEETNQTPETNQNEAQAKAESDREKNMAALRQKWEQSEREKEDYLKRLKQMEELQKQQPKRDPSDLAEMRDIEEANKKTAEELSRYRQELSELRLRAQYPDIEQTLSQKNIDKLKESDPDLAQIIADMPDDNKKAVAAYKYIKKMGIDGAKNYDQEKEAISANASRPKSSSAASGKQTPLSEMNNFIQDPAEHRKKLYREMVAAAQNR